jgi:hypothetical protein
MDLSTIKYLSIHTHDKLNKINYKLNTKCVWDQTIFYLSTNPHQKN